MEKKTKAATFIGFAVRARKLRAGLNTAGTLKRAYLILLCRSASANTEDEAIRLKRKFGCSLLKTVSADLAEYIHTDNVKIAAITDKSLAEAVKNNKENDFTEIGQEIQNG